MFKSLNTQEAVQLIKDNKDIQLLDVRSKMEADAAGFIEGSILIDINIPSSENIVKNLDKDKKYLLYCVSGARSAMLAEYMINNGFSDVNNLTHSGYSQLAMALKN